MPQVTSNDTPFVIESVPRAVATGSKSLAKSGSGICHPVATALGTDLIANLAPPGDFLDTANALT
jgi:hypothetical protein